MPPESLATVCPGLPPGLEAIVMRALQWPDAFPSSDVSLQRAAGAREVHLIEQPKRAVATANAPNCIGGVLQCSVEVGETLVVGAGAVPVTLMGVLA